MRDFREINNKCLEKKLKMICTFKKKKGKYSHNYMKNLNKMKRSENLHKNEMYI